MQLHGQKASPTIQDLGNTGMFDPRGAQGIAARGKNMYMGNNNAPGAGRPRGPRLNFDIETLQRRLMENAAATRPAAF